jgi:3-methyladenine DNA glycosylase AlkD
MPTPKLSKECSAVVAILHDMGSAEVVAFKAKKFGITSKNSLGISQKDLRDLAAQVKGDETLAKELFDTGIYEARLLSSRMMKAKNLTPQFMDACIQVFDNWEICDTFCMGLFSSSRYAVDKINEWATREPEFEKRAAFATMASYCMADKKASNATFVPFLKLITTHATDDRLYVKKAVNWALRNIGKRNKDLREAALDVADELAQSSNRCSTWIGKNVLAELQQAGRRCSDYPRAVYRV